MGQTIGFRHLPLTQATQDDGLRHRPDGVLRTAEPELAVPLVEVFPA